MTALAFPCDTTAPMRIMTAYVLSDLVKVFVAALVAFTGAMILVFLVQEGSRQGLPLTAIVRLIPFVLPRALQVTIPATLLLATTTVYSRMAGSNEVIALKALGITPMTILWPSTILSVFFSFVTVWINDAAIPWGHAGMQRVAIESVEGILYGLLRSDRCFSSKTFSIIVKDVEGRRLIRPTVWIAERAGMPPTTIEALEAQLSADLERKVLVIRLSDFRLEASGGIEVIRPGDFVREIPLSEASKADDGGGRPSLLPLTTVGGQIADVDKLIQSRKEELAAAAAVEMLTGDFDSTCGDPWKQRYTDLQTLSGLYYRLRTEPYRRWSAGFSCLFFVWVGAPIAIWLRKCDFLQSFFVCFLPILVVYYPLWMFGIGRAKDGAMHPACVWAGNVMLAIAGTWLLRKVLRY